MRIGKFGRDVELEVLVVRNDRVAEFDHETSLLPESLFTTNKQQRRQTPYTAVGPGQRGRELRVIDEINYSLNILIQPNNIGSVI